MKRQVAKESFLKDVASHELTILRDDSVYRHIRCAKPGTGCQHFEILTFPGYLVYVGDMGAYTFWRTEDMFTFFRRDDGVINPGYWSEKVEARDRYGVEKFSIEQFHENVLSEAKGNLDLDDSEALPEDAKEELCSLLNADDEYEAVQAIRDFESDRFCFDDFFENDCNEFTTRFLWCCHAIVWAIQKYDEAKSP